MDPDQKIDPAKLAEKEKYARIEKIAEIFTYCSVIGGFLITFLPNNLSIDRQHLYILFTVIFAFVVVWFRLIPRKYSGLTKTLIYYLFATAFVFVAVHFTGGIQSFAIFFFYLTVLSAAAAVSFNWFITLVFLTAALLLAEASLFGSATVAERLTLASLHIWALLIIALYSKFVFDEERKAKSFEDSGKLRSAKQLDLVKNEFVFIISNKLKQPILGLQNFLDSALASKNNSWTHDFEELLGKTRENSQRLSSLVNDLSDLSRIESQKLKLELKPINLKELVGSTLSDFSMSATEKGVKLTYQPNQEEIIVMADPSRLHEILANLIDNAIKYSPKSSVVSINFSKEGNMARMQIKDSGYGVPEEAKSHLFEKFYRVNRSATEPKGTGLGLFVTKELVERQGGKIWFESNVGLGTTFYFTLPLVTNNGNTK